MLSYFAPPKHLVLRCIYSVDSFVCETLVSVRRFLGDTLAIRLNRLAVATITVRFEEMRRIFPGNFSLGIDCVTCTHQVNIAFAQRRFGDLFAGVQFFVSVDENRMVRAVWRDDLARLAICNHVANETGVRDTGPILTRMHGRVRTDWAEHEYLAIQLVKLANGAVLT